MATITRTQSATTSAGEFRLVYRDVRWETYCDLAGAAGEAPSRLAYDGEDLEIMSPGPIHEDYREFLGELVKIIAQELGRSYRCLGSTTWKRPEIKRGIEADQCFFFDAEKLAAVLRAKKRGSNDVADYPNPDLAIEVDVSPSLVDRPGIYAALKVTEVWRCDGESVVIEQLRADGTYAPSESSRFLPVRADEVARWVLGEDTDDAVSWSRRLREWARAELANRG